MGKKSKKISALEFGSLPLHKSESNWNSEMFHLLSFVAKHHFDSQTQ